MMQPRTIEFSWPPRECSANFSGTLRERMSSKKRYRETCAKEAIAGGLRRIEAIGLHLHMEFCPPDNRARDMDNMLAACKALIDGIKIVCGVDDSRYSYTLARGPARKGGAVVVTIAPGQQ